MIKTVLLIFLGVIFALPSPVYAHLAGQTPYFKVNGIYSELYPVPMSSVADFDLPQDIAIGTFLKDEPIEFEIDIANVPVLPEVIEKTEFLWDFGDGSTATGLKSSHIYSKQGSYSVIIMAKYISDEPQLIQSTFINILPDKNYQLPKAVIEVNGKLISYPEVDILDVDFSKNISFDASKSVAGTSPIIETFWDVGDQTSNKSTSFSYRYSENPYTVYPILRIKTKDGFIADSSIQLQDESALAESIDGIDWKTIILAVLVSLILTGILTWIVYKLFFKENSKDI